LGPCAIVWSERGLLGVQIPEASEAATRARVLKRFPEARETAPPRDIASVMSGIVALLNGERRDLKDVAIDDAGVPEFNRRVYAIVRQVPPGTTITYGKIAERLNLRLRLRPRAAALVSASSPPCRF
ncbi:MAG: MGMT family protein, partial [Burkholderiales bacterium]|nr:MGMT family protein [Burkholderiales bacterium]